MERQLYLSIFSLCGTFASFAQYEAASIPDALKEGVHVVKRSEEIVFKVKDLDAASISIHEVYTILDEEGSEKLFFQIYTDKQRRIDEVDIRYYDAYGKQMGRYKKKDLKKQAYQSGLVSDGMIHYLSIGATGYPVTVEYDYVIDHTGTLTYPTYYIQESGESVQNSSYMAIVPAELDLRYMAQKTDLKPEIIVEGTNKLYKWTAKNLPAYKREEETVGATFYYPSIILAPNKFRHFNTYGEMTTWKAFGQWGYELQKGLDELTDERKAYFVTLVKNATSDREKVSLIYKYLQENFRYVSIQLGIGGVKPFPAKFTDEKKYGDCKALSLYMLAALKAVGIRSHTALINAYYNQEPVPAEFPCNRFDHMILCVPQPKDSIWLECTSNTAEFDILGTFTENRNALLLTENGGVLVSTPKSNANNNTMHSVTSIKLNEDGSGLTTTHIGSTGYYKDLLNQIVTAKKDDQKEMIVKSLGFKQPDEFDVARYTQEKEELDVNINLSIEKIPQFSAGSKMFLNPRVYPIWAKALPKSEGRKQDYYFKSPFIRTDTTIYNLPENFVAESIPAANTLKCDFASYSASYAYDKEKNQLLSVVKLELYQHKIPADKYADVKKFFDGVASADGQKLVIKKN